jgi:hypothetical protein
VTHVEPIKNPAGEALDWEDRATWFCFDRCVDCAALWSEHHLDVEDWR